MTERIGKARVLITVTMKPSSLSRGETKIVLTN